jgi:hypothetical protein
VCCTKETRRLASMMSKMLAQDKTHRTTQKALKAQEALIQIASNP